jgi:hypothetical protein
LRFDEVPLATSAPYLVKGILPREGLVVVWGPPKCGKTFVTFDMLMHVALGRQYRGRKVTAAPVVYIACEGELGLGPRIAACKRHHNIDAEASPPFYLLPTRLDLVIDCDQLINAIQQQTGDAPPGVIVIDTLNRSFGGSESSDADMGTYIKALDAVREAFRCCVTVIHHCGHETHRPRGHTSLGGAADAQLAVRNTEGVVQMVVEFMKDGEAGATISSTLKVVEVGSDVDGDPITSCVVEPHIGAAPVSRRQVSDTQQIALDCLNDVLARSGTVPPLNSYIPPNMPVVPEKNWREMYFGRSPRSRTPDAKRKAFERAAKKLIVGGAVGKWQDQVWVIRPPDTGHGQTSE